MTKIMLVEDDNNLREIYEARLTAEGYTIVSAQDGEAALALAAKERPDMIITDVMMPKISGFEMLDILRNTENLRDVKVIMLTALGQSEDNARAGALGADRYLVKSQVTLEDIVKATHDVLEGEPAATAVVSNVPTPDAAATQNEQAMPAMTIPEPTMKSEAELSQPATPPAVDSVPVVEATPAVDIAAPTATPEPVEIIEPPQTLSPPAEAEIASAPPISVEESAMQAQIENFLDSSSDGPASDPITVDAPPEEAEAEYAKDAVAPDMGRLSVHDSDIAAPQPIATPSVPTAGQAANYPSQSFELPAVPGAAIDQPATSSPPQSSGDTLVSQAIDDMIANTASQPAAPPPASPPTDPSPPAVPVTTTPTPPSDDGGSTHKLVITPLETPSRPDINQLLALEEAKTAAAQAAAATQAAAAPTSVAVEPPPAPIPAPMPPVSQPQPAQPSMPAPTVAPAAQPNQFAPAPSSDINSIAL